MITLYSYPALFGVADNNGYGLKVFAFLRLAGIPFRHEHLFDGSDAPRKQLPYIQDDDGHLVGDSDTIIAQVTARYRPALDAGLSEAERDRDLLLTRLLDDLYWVMSYSRWQDERYWPAFCAALLREHPNLFEPGLLRAREFNASRYFYQGIGRYTPEEAYARGLADLAVVARTVPAQGFVHGAAPGAIDAAIYGFLANIYFFDIDTPLRKFVTAQDNLVRHIKEIHAAVMQE